MQTQNLQQTADSIIISKLLLFVFIFLVAPQSMAASKSDRAKEKRWEEQIVPSLMVGEDVKLKAGDVDFLALYAEPATDEVKGGIILMHGIGVHPAWPDVIEPLRMTLPDKGWHTLSLQMPILENEAEGKDYPPLFAEVPSRVQAGVDFLKSKGVKNIVVSGHSLGATMATYYMAKSGDAAVKGFAIISAGPGYPKDKSMDSLENFKKIKDVNIVEFWGSEDEKQVLNTVPKRQKLGEKLHGKRYEVHKIKGANHFYRGKEDELIATLETWLDNNIAK